jgi:hypothetical protein
VLELGSGTGAAGLAVACLGARVLATDLPEILPLLRANICLNAAMVAAAGGSISAAASDWEDGMAGLGSAAGGAAVAMADSAAGGSAAAGGGLAGWGQPGEESTEWVLGADLVYSLAPVAALVRTLAALVVNGGGTGEGAAAPAASSGPQAEHHPPGSSHLLGALGRGEQAVCWEARSGASGPRGAGWGGRKLLLAHKHRHEEVDAALLEGFRAAGVPLRAVARDAGSRVTIYGNAAAMAALGLVDEGSMGAPCTLLAD